MKKRQAQMLTALLSTTLVFGCAGGDGPPAETPSAAAATRATAEAGPAATAGDDAQAAASTDPIGSTSASDTDSEGATSFRPERPPREFITAEDTSFSFNFDASDVGQKAQEKCQRQAGDDPEARLRCERRARDKFGVDVLQFVNQGGTWWWITYRRTGNRLARMNKVPVEFGETTVNTITISPVGKDQGTGPLGKTPRKVVITIPDNFSIVLIHPVRGRLVYSAKLGLIPQK
jgi:hypothetical protein